MHYLFLICSDGIPTEEKAVAMQAKMPGWIEATNASGARRIGKQLEGPETARTVRVRDGETFVSDGPFAEAKEFIAGFDIIDADNLDDAIEIAARHPVAEFHRIEVRPFFDLTQTPGRDPEALPSDDAGSSLRYMLMLCVDGVPESEAVERQLEVDGDRWREHARERGAYVFGAALAHADTAVTVRVREGKTLLSDGPFIETKEFLGGLVLLDCKSDDEALALAAAQPLAALHMVELRPFMEDDPRDR